MEKFKVGDRVKRLGYNHEGYTVIGYNGAGSVIVLPVGKEDYWSDYEIFIEQQLTKVKENKEMNIEEKYEQALDVIVGLSADIQELKDIIADRTNVIIHQREEIERLKSDTKYFADEKNYGSIVLENADLIKFQETTKRVVGDLIFNLILDELEEE